MNNNELEPAQGAPPILRYNLARINYYIFSEKKKKKKIPLKKDSSREGPIDHLHKTYDKTKETAKE